MAELTATGIGTAYDRAASAWATGPDRLYGRLAEELVAACPPLGGRLVLDIGAGTGAVTRVVEAADGEVVATDLSAGMLAHRRHLRPPSVVADVHRLPFPDAVFDAALAGFVLNHVADTRAALHEAARVTRPGGTVAATTFDAGWTHPAKEAVETAALRCGYRPPAWYTRLKAERAPAAGEPDTLRSAADAAGLTHARAWRTTVDGGLHTPADIVDWRLGMANLAPFVASLTPNARHRLVASAIAEVGDRPPPVRPRIIILTAQV